MTIGLRPRAARRLAVLIALLAAVFAGVLTPAAAANAAAAVPTVVNGVRLNPFEARLLARINGVRAARRLPVLVVAPGYTDVARRWALSQASRNRMAHNPNMKAQLVASGGSQWRVLGENVGYARDADTLFTAYMNSPGHRANILNARYRYVGIGWVTTPSGIGYNTQNFVSSYSAAYGPCRVAMRR